MEKKRCISCGSELLDDIVHIGDQYPSAIFVDESDGYTRNLEATSLNLTMCSNENCKLVQLSSKYDLQYVFDHYPYESDSTATMATILKDVVDGALRFTSITESDVVLDIGGNDGTLLSLIKEPCFKVNIDAAAGVEQALNNDPCFIYKHAKFSSDVYDHLGILPKPKLIFSVAMFYHLNDPISFCRDIYRTLADDGVWVLQMTYLGTMLLDNILDNIVHEHAAYYSLFSLRSLLSRVGLYVHKAEIVDSYGGSLRVYIRKSPADAIDGFMQVQSFEKENKINTLEALQAFDSRVQLLKRSLRSLVEHIVQDYGRIGAFGASTKGCMLLQFLNLDETQFYYALDNSTKKIGKKTIGSLIPIRDEKSVAGKLPKYLFVLPYYYTKAFVGIIRKLLLEGQSVYLIIPLPYPKVIKVESGGE